MRCDSEAFQIVRIIDVIVLGPLMLRVGSKLSGFAGTFLTAAGIATIVFNGLTFVDIERRKE